MYRIITTTLLALAPVASSALATTATTITPARGDFGSGVIEGGNSLYIASELQDALATLENDAAELSDEAAHAGYEADAQALSDLAQDADSLSQSVTNSVIVPLQRLVAVPKVLGYAQRLDSGFDTLSYDASNLETEQDTILSDIQAAYDLQDALKTELANSERSRPTRAF